MLKTTGLIAGHYECRSLAETLPVFTDLLAMKIVEQKTGEATLKHPNTDWRLIVHEGGPDAPEKTFDNHYGFRVASHEEVEAAWKYIETNKEKYHLSKITKPQSAHFAYSIYFREPGGNHLEIEYYNPGGALHGRSHTAGHWESRCSERAFPGRGYVPQAFTHGTLQCDDLERSRRFYIEVLGSGNRRGFQHGTIHQTSQRRRGISSSCKRQPAPISRAGESFHPATRVQPAKSNRLITKFWTNGAGRRHHRARQARHYQRQNQLYLQRPGQKLVGANRLMETNTTANRRVYRLSLVARSGSPWLQWHGPDAFLRRQKCSSTQRHRRRRRRRSAHARSDPRAVEKTYPRPSQHRRAIHARRRRPQGGQSSCTSRCGQTA